MKWIVSPGRPRRMVAGAMAALLFIVMTAVPSDRGWALSLSEEKELGAKLLEAIREQMPLVEDGEIITYLATLGNRIARQVGTTPYNYQFFVVDQSVPNAFAVPGGYIFVYRGLIDLMKSEGELAAVISHELAHIQAHHLDRRMKEGRVLNIASIAGLLAGILLGVAGGGGAGQALAVGSLAGSASAVLKYSRENEQEADQLGFRYLCAAGYSPQNMPDAMRRLRDGNFISDSKFPSYLSTHPAINERIQYLDDMVRKQQAKSPKGASVQTVGDFAIMKAALTAEYANAQDVMPQFETGAAKGDAAALYGLGRLYLRQGKVQEALPYLEKAARQAAGSPFILSSLGALYFQQGRLADAKKMFESALSLDSTAPIVHYRLALVLRDMGSKQEALEQLQQVEELAPTFPEINYQLGVVLGEVNRLGDAHLHLGRYYVSKQDWKLAIYHYKKAAVLLKGTPQGGAELDEIIAALEKNKKEAAYEKARRKK